MTTEISAITATGRAGLRVALLCASVLFLPREPLAQILPLQTYSTREGLPSNNVTALWQDSRGFLLIGTDNGLCIYNGATFEVIGMAEGLPNSYITTIRESRTTPGCYWLGTIAGGLVRLHGSSVRSFTAGGNNVGDVREDAAGRIWCVITDSLYRLEAGSLLRVDAVRHAEGLEILDDSILVVLSDSALSLLRPPFTAPTPFGPRLVSGETFAAILIDSAQTIWAATSRGDLLAIGRDGRLMQRYHLGFERSIDIPMNLVRDHTGRIWVTSTTGLMSFIVPKGSGRGTIGYHARGVFNPLLIDREEILWTGGPNCGLIKIAERRITVVPVDSLHVGLYNQVACNDSAGTIWATTTAGLREVRHRGSGGWSSYTHPQLPEGRSFGQLLTAPSGELWTSAFPSIRYLAFRITPGTEGPSMLIPSGEIGPLTLGHGWPGFTFTVDRHRRVWGPWGTRVRVTDSATRTVVGTYGPAAGLPGEEVRALLMDSHGTLWSGSWTTGISRLTPGATRFETFPDFAGVIAPGVRSLLEDREGTLWIGTRFGGLVRYRNGTFTAVTVRDGLVSNAVWSIAETRRRIWIGTDVGLQSVNKESLLPYPKQPPLLVGRVYATGAFHDEYVWFVAADGIHILEAPEEAPAPHPPPVYITSFLAGGHAGERGTGNALPFDRNTCTFEFVGVSFLDEHAVTYQYRMLGLDSAWSEPRQQRSVIFASLEPGDYRFEVRAISAAGSASIRPAGLSFSIVPPFWQRWWFLTFVAAVLAGSGLLLYRYRVHRLLEMERLRTRIAEDLHDDVGTNLSSIMLASEIIERELPLVSEQRRRMSELRMRAGTTQDMLKDIVWLLNPRNDTLEDFLLKLKELARRQLVTVPSTFTVSGEHRVENIPLEFKRTVVLFFKEAVTNIAKHAQATAVTVNLSLDDEVFRLTISDNGRGFDPGVPANGDGLNNLRARARHIGGTVEISSTPLAGTTISLSSRITYTRSIRERKTSVS
jgi:signal transduction histidine kinase/ligand-binding sensor domain-containing protein